MLSPHLAGCLPYNYFFFILIFAWRFEIVVLIIYEIYENERNRIVISAQKLLLNYYSKWILREMKRKKHSKIYLSNQISIFYSWSLFVTPHVIFFLYEIMIAICVAFIIFKNIYASTFTNRFFRLCLKKYFNVVNIYNKWFALCIPYRSEIIFLNKNEDLI